MVRPAVQLAVAVCAKATAPIALTSHMALALLRLINSSHHMDLVGEDDAADVSFARAAPLRMVEDGVTLLQAVPRRAAEPSRHGIAIAALGLRSLSARP